jgi:hypothetical protein
VHVVRRPDHDARAVPGVVDRDDRRARLGDPGGGTRTRPTTLGLYRRPHAPGEARAARHRAAPAPGRFAAERHRGARSARRRAGRRRAGSADRRPRGRVRPPAAPGGAPVAGDGSVRVFRPGATGGVGGRPGPVAVAGGVPRWAGAGNRSSDRGVVRAERGAANLPPCPSAIVAGRRRPHVRLVVGRPAGRRPLRRSATSSRTSRRRWTNTRSRCSCWPAC